MAFKGCSRRMCGWFLPSSERWIRQITYSISWSRRSQGANPGVRAFEGLGHHAEYEDDSKKPRTLAQVLRKNNIMIKAMAMLNATFERAENIKVPGMQYGDVPFDLDAKGLSWRDRLDDLILRFYILNEHLSRMLRTIAMFNFYVFTVFITVSCFLAVPNWEGVTASAALSKAFSLPSLRLLGARAHDTFRNISSPADVNAWMRGPLLDAAYPPNGTAWAGNPGMIAGNFLLLEPVRLRQLRVRADSCPVPKDVWMRPGQALDDLVLAATDLTDYNMFSRELSLQAYVLDCTINLPAPLGTPGCGMVQEYSGHWFASLPRGQVGELSGCYSDLDAASEARANYGPIDLGDVTSDTYNMSRWTWASSSTLGTSEGVVARFGDWYSGDGYAIDLDPSREKAAAQIEQAVDSGWIDKSTRAVFVNVRAYNPSVESITSLTLMVELGSAGGAVPWIRVQTVQKSDVDVSAASGGAIQVHVVTFILVLAYLCWEIYDIRRRTLREYLWEQYHFQDIASYLLYVIGFSVRLSAFTGNAFPPAAASPPQTPASFADAALAMKIWRACLALDVLMVYLRLLRMSPNAPVIRRLYLTVNRLLDMVVSALLGLSLALLGYGLAFHLGFGHALLEFRSPATSFFTALRMIRGGLGRMDLWDRLWESNSILGPLFFITWTVLGGVVTVGIFSAAAYAALKDVAETLPVETIRGYLAKVASAYLIEIERRKSITDYAKTAYEKKLARTEGKGGTVEVLQDAMKRLKSRVGGTNDVKPGTESSQQQQQSKQSLEQKEREMLKDGLLVRFLKRVAGYSRNEIVEEKVTVTERKLREIEGKLGSITGIISQLSLLTRAEDIDTGAILSKVRSKAWKDTKSQDPKSSLGKDSLGPGPRKKKPNGFFSLTSTTSHAKAATVTKKAPEVQSTRLNFRVVDAKGAANLRSMGHRDSS